MEPKKKKILIVEDEYIVRESLRDWLVEDGYEVECCENGEEALEIVKNEDIGFVVLDLRLPGIDGLQLFEKVKEFKPETKAVIITAYPTKEKWEKAKSLGVIDFLPKPFQVADLEKVIGGALDELKEHEKDNKHLWLQLGAGSYRLCDRNYECDSCPTGQAVLQGRYDTITFLSDDEVKRLKQLSNADEKFCRYGTVRFFKRDKPYLEK
jgi:YesN/AraC family two-component response regulator